MIGWKVALLSIPKAGTSASSSPLAVEILLLQGGEDVKKLPMAPIRGGNRLVGGWSEEAVLELFEERCGANGIKCHALPRRCLSRAAGRRRGRNTWRNFCVYLVGTFTLVAHDGKGLDGITAIVSCVILRTLLCAPLGTVVPGCA
jgi:hypothetical protein